MLSDQELARYVESFVRQAAAVPGAVAAAGGISAESVARQLGPQLGLDLTPKAPLIRDILLALFSPPPQGAPFTSSAPSPSASASASASAAAAGHFFSQQQQQQQQQLQTFLTASQQYQHRGGAGAAAAPPSAYGVAAAAAGYRYGQPFPQDEGAHLQRLVQMHHHHHQQQQQQQQMAAAAAGVAAAPPTAVESPRPAAASKKESASTGVKRRGGPGGLNKVCGVSPELQAIVGEPTMARTEIVKQLWAYIRRNNLQDPNNKRKIICNDELRLVFETDSTDMFKMNKLLAKHIRPLEAKKDSNRDSKKLKPVDSEPISPAETDVNQLPIILSDALASFFGTGEKEMPSSEAVKRVWDHIKSNNLEDPANPTMILCDSKLKQLFGCESLTAMNRLTGL
uniref:DM2 domain-containing protein n=1 Tax=Oryza nivara TaxID=4536 RepID=A0A0E0IE09_ORYNI